MLNKKATAVMARMSDKLTGRDFSNSSFSSISNRHSLNHGDLTSGDSHEVEHGLSVKLQVKKLILQATSNENLCQNYLGYGAVDFTLLTYADTLFHFVKCIRFMVQMFWGST